MLGWVKDIIGAVAFIAIAYGVLMAGWVLDPLVK